LANRLGKQAWQTGLANRLGKQAWQTGLANRLGKQAWLETFLALPKGIPSHDPFRRVFMLIDPDAFEVCFTRWVQAWARGVAREG
jgi:hypothetical protein